MTQLDLPLADRATPEQAEAARLAAYLFGRVGWSTAAQITAALALTDRRIRRLASIAGDLIVSGPGCPGYKHLRRCNPDELAEAAARLEHQAALMSRRAGRMRAAAHRAIHRS